MSAFVRIEKGNVHSELRNVRKEWNGLKGLQGTCRFVLYELSEKQKQTNRNVTNTCFVDITNKADNLSRKKLPYLLTDTVKDFS